MPFKPVNQINTIIRQQYFEPTISWSLRVVLALNVPLIVIPFYRGFSYEVIWSAFGAYMLSLIDYRGLHYRKIIIQSLTALLVFVAALAGMYVSHSVVASVLAMFTVGLLAGLLRNWKDYGASMAVSLGFFFLLGLATPARGAEAMAIGLYLLTGCAWAIVITLVSFPLQPSNPVRRSVANIWKANTDLLDVMVRKLVSDQSVTFAQITEKELAIRKTIDQSRGLFSSQQVGKRSKNQHYNSMLALRKTASLFAATLSSLHEELEVINTERFQAQQEGAFYKTLSAFAQASARHSIVMFTFRAADLAIAKVRVQRCEAAAELFSRFSAQTALAGNEGAALLHFSDTLGQALQYLQQSLGQAEEKMRLDKSDYLENYRLSFHEFVEGLRPNALGEVLQGLLRVNWQQLNYALRVALGLALGIFLYKFFKIDHGYWIALTMMIVIQPYYGATLRKGMERILGTLAGIVLGGVILLLPLSHQAVTGLLVVDSFFVAYFLRNNYKVGVFFVTIMMVLLMQISQQGNWELIGWRILSTLIGAVLALIAGYAFWPVWERERFPALLANALKQNRDYLLHIIRFLQKDLPASESWQKYRRLAEGANNLAFTSAQRMAEEPRNLRQQAETSFVLIGASIRITRELTSIALQAQAQKNALLGEDLSNLKEEFLLAFDELVTMVTELPEKGLNLETLKKNLHGPFFDQSPFARFIRTEFEKVSFELEAMSLLKSKHS